MLHVYNPVVRRKWTNERHRNFDRHEALEMPACVPFATHLSARRISGVTNTRYGLPNTARHEEAASRMRDLRYNLRSSARRLSHYMPGVTRYSVADGIGLYLATTAKPTTSGAIHRDLPEVLCLWIQDGRCVLDKFGRLPDAYTVSR
jgi:hypothetical protein